MKIGYSMTFTLEDHQGPAVDSLSLIERIMEIIQLSDGLLSDTLGYSITFHSMLASMEAKGFTFQIDMEIDPPEQLILGDSLSGVFLENWFSRSHEVLTHFVMDQESIEKLYDRWETILDQFHQCRDNLLYRPPSSVQLEQLQRDYRELWSSESRRLNFSMKKVL